MNNAKIAMDSVDFSLSEPEINLDAYKEREQKLVNVIELLREVQGTKAWSSLKRQLFDELPDSLNRQISQEAKKLTPDIHKLNRLAGELKWAEGYADFKKLEETFRVELQNVRKQMYGTS